MSTVAGTWPGQAPISVIVNPISGTGRRLGAGRDRAAQARALLAARGATADVRISERGGQAAELTRAAYAGGARMVFAWGGDGTVNEVASVLAGSEAVLGIIPAGSGNGLARELGIPRDPAAAVAAAWAGADRRIDAGELGGRLFFNVAGVGLDARIAAGFAAGGERQRGLSQYVRVSGRELFAFDGLDCAVSTDGVALGRRRVLLVALANGTQYGNGARIAPGARLDDGRLDVVVVAHRPAWTALAQAPLLFAGLADRIPGVHTTRATAAEIAADGDIVYHVDGEVAVARDRLAGRVHPGALRVRAPSR